MTIARLILLNGPPGVGKSTIARRYIEDHPLALLLEVDALRMSMGAWQRHDESRMLARGLALALADAHLRSGHDVIVPQYLGRTQFIDALERVADRGANEFVEVLMQDDADAVLARFKSRRRALAESKVPHPEADLDDADLSAAITDAFAHLRLVASQRPEHRVIVVSGSIERTYEELRRVLGDTGL